MKRLKPTSPAPAPPLEDDDLLAEFLLRLPPQPSTLPRISLVCKRWRRLVTDPRFLRRFREFHRLTPPLHGFITRSGLFFPAQEPPDRLPPTRFWRDRWCGEADAQHRWAVHCCRHGLILCCRSETNLASDFVVVDPAMTGYRRRTATLRRQHGDDGGGALLIASTVVSVAGAADRRAFLVVALLAHFQSLTLTASVYSSESGAWAGSITAVEFPPSPATIRMTHHPSSLVGDGIYWFLKKGEIVRFDLGTRRLSIIEQRPHPPDLRLPWSGIKSWILPPAAGDGGRFCLAVLCGLSIEFWEREAELISDAAAAAAEWVLCRTVELDKKVLPVEFQDFQEHAHMQAIPLGISGFDEESNAIFLWTHDGVFMSHIVEAMQFNKVLERRFVRMLSSCLLSRGCYLHPYSSV